ncbi:hypothetical protein [Corynebacterium sp. HMSC04H06]|uniref:hypothetical protein n=1 Tax=Corynebacterium sp. HMSC04H06 TaxID=1581050 RepID=UPI0008A3AC72|nr:hypothetical protein [Corynebacterium sp. HMSC04H06]
MRKLIAGLAAAASLGLAACGSATVDNDNEAEAPTSVAPLERGSESESASASESESAESSTTASAPAGDRAPEDRGAEEISEIPSPEEDSSAGDADFLGAAGERDIDTAGVEAQLVSAAQRVCVEEEPITLNAISGQLIEQGRTDLDYEELTRFLADEARSAYC